MFKRGGKKSAQTENRTPNPSHAQRDLNLYARAPLLNINTLRYTSEIITVLSKDVFSHGYQRMLSTKLFSIFTGHG